MNMKELVDRELEKALATYEKNFPWPGKLDLSETENYLAGIYSLTENSHAYYPEAIWRVSKNHKMVTLFSLICFLAFPASEFKFACGVFKIETMSKTLALTGTEIEELIKEIKEIYSSIQFEKHGNRWYFIQDQKAMI